MNCRCFSKPVSGDTWTEGDAAGAGDEAVFEVLGEPPHAAKSDAAITNTGPMRPISLKPRSLITLLIPNIHDRALRILINNIKPPAQPRLLEKLVMRVV